MGVETTFRQNPVWNCCNAWILNILNWDYIHAFWNCQKAYKGILIDPPENATWPVMKCSKKSKHIADVLKLMTTEVKHFKMIEKWSLKWSLVFLKLQYFIAHFWRILLEFLCYLRMTLSTLQMKIINFSPLEFTLNQKINCFHLSDNSTFLDLGLMNPLNESLCAWPISWRLYNAKYASCSVLEYNVSIDDVNADVTFILFDYIIVELLAKKKIMCDTIKCLLTCWLGFPIQQWYLRNPTA